MSNGPYLIPNTSFRYGNWAGGGYSANTLSPAFIPLTDGQRSIKGVDAFDSVAARHDIAYDNAQQSLIKNLADGKAGSAAVRACLVD